MLSEKRRYESQRLSQDELAAKLNVVRQTVEVGARTAVPTLMRCPCRRRWGHL